MTLFLAKRAFTMVLTLVAASLVVFVVLEVLPGDPALTILGVDAEPAAVEALRQRLGFDLPAALRYLTWLGELARGEFGQSYTYSVPVSELIRQRLGVTVPLALISMALTAVAALTLGVYAAARHNRLGDVGVMSLSQLGIAVPNFWFAILLILFFSVYLGWLPAGGFAGWDAGVGPALTALVLPAISLTLVQVAILARVTRSAVLDVSREDFVRTARAKGLSRDGALVRHVLRNAMIPILTIMGLQFANLLAGTIVVENVFHLPGLGRLVFQAITQRDLIVVRDVVVLLAAMVIVVNFLVDVLYAVVDPRVKLQG